jgi:hypothetical protein
MKIKKTTIIIRVVLVWMEEFILIFSNDILVFDAKKIVEIHIIIFFLSLGFKLVFSFGASDTTNINRTMIPLI